MVHKIAPPQAPKETTTLYKRSLISSDNVALHKRTHNIKHTFLHTCTCIMYMYI